MTSTISTHHIRPEWSKQQQWRRYICGLSPCLPVAVTFWKIPNYTVDCTQQCWWMPDKSFPCILSLSTISPSYSAPQSLFFWLVFNKGIGIRQFYWKSSFQLTRNLSTINNMLSPGNNTDSFLLSVSRPPPCTGQSYYCLAVIICPLVAGLADKSVVVALLTDCSVARAAACCLPTLSHEKYSVMRNPLVNNTFYWNNDQTRSPVQFSFISKPHHRTASLINPLNTSLEPSDYLVVRS